MKSQNKIIEFYPSGKIEILDDIEGSFSERFLSLKRTGYLIKTIYLDSLVKKKLKESITWDPDKTSLHKIAKLEVSGHHKEIASKLAQYLRDCRIADISPFV